MAKPGADVEKKLQEELDALKATQKGKISIELMTTCLLNV